MRMAEAERDWEDVDRDQGKDFAGLETDAAVEKDAPHLIPTRLSSIAN